MAYLKQHLLKIILGLVVSTVTTYSVGSYQQAKSSEITLPASGEVLSESVVAESQFVEEAVEPSSPPSPSTVVSPKPTLAVVASPEPSPLPSQSPQGKCTPEIKQLLVSMKENDAKIEELKKQKEQYPVVSPCGGMTSLDFWECESKNAGYKEKNVENATKILEIDAQIASVNAQSPNKNEVYNLLSNAGLPYEASMINDFCSL